MKEITIRDFQISGDGEYWRVTLHITSDSGTDVEIAHETQEPSSSIDVDALRRAAIDQAILALQTARDA